MIKAIVGANWGDEGKGKVVDMYANNYDIVIRYQGGSNAGHTIINDYGRFALHQMPSGAFSKDTINVIGNGVALHVPNIIKEINELKEKRITPNLVISDKTTLLLKYHILFDTYEEERLKDKGFGSTKSGIAPFYSDKYLKIGIRVHDLFNDTILKEKVKNICSIKNPILKNLYHKPLLSENELLDELYQYKELLSPYIKDTVKFMHDAIKNNKNILLEGQLGALRDPELGIYPYVTSSSTLAGFASVGVGIPPHKIESIVAVTKAYSSCVGAGPFVSEIFGEEAQELRLRGGDKGEFGATTGRPRRMGWFDCVATRYGATIQGATEIALTCLDVLSYLENIPVCIGYEVNGVLSKDFDIATLDIAKPVLTYLKGWKKDIRGITDLSLLPKEALEYIAFLENEIGVPITIISTGPKRSETIFK
ncbi:Adenylosuccinate synthetase [Alteracholeplasma palmae J233]|uniref:Adenylosuccinate synthetase n=1 Tax=Alteracholeplasma palmae (strain ATCC 49389 / J233) TaxID=1318466 RepID=U4KK75_ALTPJ|nr:adenylosuccinate synthase [Alteracholeplasma palmae]CCV63937.1 Adenylosuccinate synthetase [Alteracholeplasma palmae J233]